MLSKEKSKCKVQGQYPIYNLIVPLYNPFSGLESRCFERCTADEPEVPA